MTSPEALVEEVSALLRDRPEIAGLTGLGARPFSDFADLAGRLLAATAGLPEALVARHYEADPGNVAVSLQDIHETARRNFEPGGAAASLLFARGVQAVMGHRVAHGLWRAGDEMLAMAVKARCARAFSTDIHPGAWIGAGFWLDHGLGFVAGETCVIGRNVSIWHNVTLGSTLADSGPRRHPVVGDGAVIGAGAMVLGHVTVGAGANIAAGAIVTKDVPAGRLVAGPRASDKGAARIGFAPTGEGQ